MKFAKQFTVILFIGFLLLSCSDKTTEPSYENGWQGSGTADDPYQIVHHQHLKAFADSVNAGIDYQNQYFVMTANISLADYQADGGWQPIGHAVTDNIEIYSQNHNRAEPDSKFAGRDDWEEYPFKGTFDGNGYKINHLFIDRVETDPPGSMQGLFGFIKDAEIKNLELEDINVGGLAYIGSLVGFAVSSNISECSVSGEISGNLAIGGLAGHIEETAVFDSYSDVDIIGISDVTTVQEPSNIGGGLIGWAESSNIDNCNSTATVNVVGSAGGLIGGTTQSTVTNSYSNSEVDVHYTGGCLIGVAIATSISNCNSAGSLSGDSDAIGGLVGRANNANITISYSTSTVSGYDSVGGLIGLAELSTISNCYSIGEVTGSAATGGLVGFNYGDSQIINSYSNGVTIADEDGGGLVGFNHDNATVVNSYWDMETSGQSTSAAGEGRTTDEMTYPYAENTYVDWDFEEIWAEDMNHNINGGYPYLIE